MEHVIKVAQRPHSSSARLELPTIYRIDEEHLDPPALRVLVLLDGDLDGHLVKHPDPDLRTIWLLDVLGHADLVRLGIVVVLALERDQAFQTES